MSGNATSDDDTIGHVRRGTIRERDARTLPPAPDEPLARVLLAEADAGVVNAIADTLRTARIDVMSAQSGHDALTIAERMPFTLLLFDLQLPDMSGFELVQRLRRAGVERPFIAMGAHAPVPVVVAAMRLGASTLLELPFEPGALIEAVRTAVEPASAGDEPSMAGVRQARTTPPRSTAERWARFVWCVTDAASDPKTLTEWARIASVSRSVLAECCRLVRVSPRNARDFARVLRALTRSGDRWQPEAVLDFADARTLKKLLQSAGLANATQAPDIAEFLDRQQWIPHDNPGLSALRQLLAHGRQ